MGCYDFYGYFCAITTTGVTVTFSSALAADVTGATVAVVNPAGETVAVTAQDLVAGATEATFAFETALDSVAIGTWTVAGVEYVQASVPATVTVEAITVEENGTATPVVTVLDQDGNTIEDATLTYSSNNEAVAAVATDGTITAGAYSSTANTATLTVTAGDVTGTAVVTVTKDTTKPEIASVEAISGNQIKVVFSEKVDSTTAQTITNYKLYSVAVFVK